MNECVGRECVKVQLPLDKDLESIALTAYVNFLSPQIENFTQY